VELFPIAAQLTQISIFLREGVLKLSESKNRIEELISRVKDAKQAQHNASERLARHQKLATWTLVLLAFALVIIPLMQPLDVRIEYLHVAEVVLATLVIVYAVLMSQEKFGSQSNAMRHGSIDLERLARKMTARDHLRVTEAEYAKFADEFFDIIELYDNPQPVDRLFVRIENKPRAPADWPGYLYAVVRAYLSSACSYFHYVVSMTFVAFLFTTLLMGLHKKTDEVNLDLRSAWSLFKDFAKGDNACCTGKAMEKER
jgi:hypothetical protein